MYPSTTFKIDDESAIATVAAVTDSVDRPIFMCGFSSDKGPEDYRTVVGSTFFDLYGTTPSFKNHGQTLLQAAAIINAGGKVFSKRIVAEDARLANIGVVANVKKVIVQKTDTNGNPLYQNTSGGETIDPTGNTPIMVQKCGIALSLKTVNIAGDGITAMAATFLADNAHTNQDGEDGHYPLFLISDNGRGVSNKKFRIYPDTSANRPVSYVKYILEVQEDIAGVLTTLETMSFTMNPDIISNNANISLQTVVQNNSNQIRCKMFDNEINAFIENVSYIIGDKNNTFEVSDILYGNDVYGKSIDKIIVDTTVNLSNAYGTSLIGGDNGAFGTTPISAATYASELVKVFNGTADDTIYDLDNNRIDVIFDANFPALVKRAIEGLVNFREDCLYFRDLGTGLASVDEIILANTNSYASRFCATYHNSWDVIDPYTKKQITVTCMYSLVTNFVKHFLNGRSRPFAGQKYEVTFPSVIDGTVNFIPKKTPSVDQKQDLDSVRINYAAYYSGLLVMETLYTSQTLFSQLSYLSNILNIQELIKAIRVKCPKIRYDFADGTELAKYKADVNSVINSFTSQYEDIYMDYVADATYVSNKIFYAVIYVKLRNFFQAESFKIVAIAS